MDNKKGRYQLFLASPFKTPPRLVVGFGSKGLTLLALRQDSPHIQVPPVRQRRIWRATKHCDSANYLKACLVNLSSIICQAIAPSSGVSQSQNGSPGVSPASAKKVEEKRRLAGRSRKGKLILLDIR